MERLLFILAFGRQLNFLINLTGFLLYRLLLFYITSSELESTFQQEKLYQSAEGFFGVGKKMEKEQNGHLYII